MSQTLRDLVRKLDVIARSIPSSQPLSPIRLELRDPTPTDLAEAYRLDRFSSFSPSLDESPDQAESLPLRSEVSSELVAKYLASEPESQSSDTSTVFSPRASDRTTALPTTNIIQLPTPSPIAYEPLEVREEPPLSVLRTVPPVSSSRELDTFENLPYVTFCFSRPVVSLGSAEMSSVWELSSEPFSPDSRIEIRLSVLESPTEIEDEGEVSAETLADVSSWSGVVSGEGTWRWIGTRQLRLLPGPAYRGRFGRSRTYSFGVDICQDDAPKVSTLVQFRTPSVEIHEIFPPRIDPSQPRVPSSPFSLSCLGSKLIYLQLNQRIKPEHMRRGCVVLGKRSRMLQILKWGESVRVLSLDEVARFLLQSTAMQRKRRELWLGYVRRLKDQLEVPPSTSFGAERVWILVTSDLLPNSDLTIKLSKGFESAEGPGVTQETHTKVLRMSPEFVVVSHYPSGAEANPRSSLHLYFSNEIDQSDDESHMESILEAVRVQPSLEKKHIAINGSCILISGLFTPRTTYVVRISRESPFRDVFGQCLSRNLTQSFRIGPDSERLYSNMSGLIVLDADDSEDPEFVFYTVNIPKVRLLVFQVQPEEYHFSIFGSDRTQDSVVDGFNPRERVGCGEVCFDRVVETVGPQDQPNRQRVNLRRFLQNSEEKLGHLIVYVEKSAMLTSIFRFVDRPRIVSWIQVTRLAVDAFSSVGPRISVVCSLLSNGSPVPNAQASVILARGEREEHGGLWSLLKKQKCDVSEYESVTFAENCNGDGIAELWIGSEFENANLPSCLAVARIPNGDAAFVPNLALRSLPEPQLICHAFTDRGLYKPSETVQIKGYFRMLRVGRGGVRTVAFADNMERAELPWVVTDRVGVEFATGFLSVLRGQFSLEILLPGSVNLGTSTVRFGQRGHTLQFNIQEFRKPEFRVETEIVPRDLHFLGGVALCSISARYFSGGPLVGANVEVSVSASREAFVLSEWESFSFCPIASHSWFGRSEALTSKCGSDGKSLVAIGLSPGASVRTGPIRVRVVSNVSDLDSQVVSSSSAFVVHLGDAYVGLRSHQHFVHPNEPAHYDVVAVNTSGTPILDCQIRVDLLLSSVSQIRNSQDEASEEAIIDTVEILSLEEPCPVTFRISESGMYVIRASLAGPSARSKNIAELNLSVFGGPSVRGIRYGGKVPLESVVLLGDKKEYFPGDEAKILVQSPLSAPVVGILQVFHHGLVEKRSLEIEDGAKVVTVAIRGEYAPQLLVTVHLRGVAPLDEENMRTAHASGEVILKVNPVSVRVEVETPSVLAPGSSGICSILVAEADSRSDVCVVMVDEAVLSLSGYKIPSILQAFHPSIPRCVATGFGRSSVFLRNFSSDSIGIGAVITRTTSSSRSAGALCEKKTGSSGKTKASEQSLGCRGGSSRELVSEFVLDEALLPDAVTLRQDFRSLVVFAELLTTDDVGRLELPFTLPDNLTEYRVTALATSQVAAGLAGIGESRLLARLPLACRVTVPRFLNYEDVAQFSVVLENQSGRSLRALAAAKCSSQLEFLRADDAEVRSGYEVKLGAVGSSSRAVVTFSVRAVACGKATFQVIAVVPSSSPDADPFADSVREEIAIYPPFTTDDHAMYGQLTAPVGFETAIESPFDSTGPEETYVLRQPVVRPRETLPSYGGVAVSLSSTAIQALTDSFVLMLDGYESLEQVASRLLSIVILEDVLESFNAPQLPSREELDATVESCLAVIRDAQNSKGGFGFWSLLSIPDVFLSVHVAHCLIRVRACGRDVHSETLKRCCSFLRQVRLHLRMPWYWGMSRIAKVAIQCFAVYVLTLYSQHSELCGSEDQMWILREARRLYRKNKDLSFECLAWIVYAMFHTSELKGADPDVRRILYHLVLNVHESEDGSAFYITSYSTEDCYRLLHSSRRTDAILLDVLLSLAKGSELLPKLAKGLLAHRIRGKWKSSQESAYALIALRRYFDTVESTVPDFQSSIFLDEEFVAEIRFRGREVESRNVKIPLERLEEGNEKMVSLCKKGEGICYYRIGLSFATKQLAADSIDRGFVVERSYEAVSEQSDVEARECPQGYFWRVKLGKLVRVRLKMITPCVRYHVALIDLFPAAFEVLNPEFKTSEPVQPTRDPELRAPRRRSIAFDPVWFDHQNLRDERVEVFSSRLVCGSYEYSYLARVTSVGDFVCPPTKAEEIYSPEVFGRSRAEKLTVFE